MRKIVALLVAVLAVGFLAPAQASAAGGGDYYGGGESTCPDGYDGPRDDGLCYRETVEVFDATEIVTYVCDVADGFVGPDAYNECTRTTNEVEVVHVEEGYTTVCPDGLTFVGDVCYIDVVEITETDPVDVVSYDCPPGYLGPDGNNQCSKDVDTTEYAAVVVTPFLECTAPAMLVGTSCLTDVDADRELTCPDGYVLNLTLNPPKCVGDSDLLDPIEVVSCLAGYDGPYDIGGVATCRKTDPATLSTTVECPAGFTDPDGDGVCTKGSVTTEVIDATEIKTPTCPDGSLGPDSGRCVIIGTKELQFPAVTVPVFTCPDGFDGPDAYWNCSKDVVNTETVPAEKVVTYDCPDDSEGPNHKNQCVRTIIDVVEPTKQTRKPWRCEVQTGGGHRAGVEVHETKPSALADEYVLYNKHHEEVITLSSSDTTEAFWRSHPTRWEIEWEGDDYNYHVRAVYYVAARNYGEGESEKLWCNRRDISPIGLDLDGSGAVERIEGDFAFDINGDGAIDEVTEWFAPTEGILFDTRIDGEISGRHVFGDEGGLYQDGYAKLAQLDANADGRVAGYELDGLAVWTDANSNARLDAGEVTSVSDLGLASFDTSHFDYVSTATFEDGSILVTEDLWFPATLATPANSSGFPVGWVLAIAAASALAGAKLVSRRREHDAPLQAERIELRETLATHEEISV